MVATQTQSQTPSADTAQGKPTSQATGQATNADLAKERFDTKSDSLLVQSTQAAIAHEGFKTVRTEERPSLLENFGRSLQGQTVEGTKVDEKRVPIVSSEPAHETSAANAAVEPSKKPENSVEPTNQKAPKLKEDEEDVSLQTAA